MTHVFIGHILILKPKLQVISFYYLRYLFLIKKKYRCHIICWNSHFCYRLWWMGFFFCNTKDLRIYSHPYFRFISNIDAVIPFLGNALSRFDLNGDSSTKGISIIHSKTNFFFISKQFFFFFSLLNCKFTWFATGILRAVTNLRREENTSPVTLPAHLFNKIYSVATRLWYVAF